MTSIVSKEEPKGETARQGARAGAERTCAYPTRHARGHGFLEYHRPLHPIDDCGDIERPRHKGHSNVRPSCRSVAADIAGEFAFVVFALGIVGTGMLAVPVLAGSAAYALGEALRWRVGLSQKPRRAKAFYGAIAAATLVGAAINFSPLDPIKALFWSAVINGVAAVPIMIMIMHLGSRRTVMGEFTLGLGLKTFGWLATAVMAAAAIGMCGATIRMRIARQSG